MPSLARLLSSANKSKSKSKSTSNAIIASDGQSLSHTALSSFVNSFTLPIEHISSSGKKPVVVLALPNGPVLALALMATMNYCTAIPININAGADQIRNDIAQVDADVVIVTEDNYTRSGLDGKWVGECGLQILLLMTDGLIFTLKRQDGQRPSGEMRLTPNGEDDITLLLFTSGTTSFMQTLI